MRPVRAATSLHRSRRDPSTSTGWKRRAYAPKPPGITDPMSCPNGCSRGPIQAADETSCSQPNPAPQVLAVLPPSSSNLIGLGGLRSKLLERDRPRYVSTVYIEF